MPGAVPAPGAVPGAVPPPPDPSAVLPGAPPRVEVRSPLSDGEWHHLHPLTPVLRGGLFLLVIIGIVVANLRDRLITFFLPHFDGEEDYLEYEGDPIDFIVANNLILVAALALLGLLLVLLGIFWVSWRFHTFRITGDDVEVRSGVLSRTHRRAPLDRVQGVHLTRPLIARLLGMAKLEVVGAGTDANVKLEYLSTANAETVRGDILRLASGRQLAESTGAKGRMPVSHAAATAVSEGITGLIVGAEYGDAEPESIVHIPPGRLVAAHLLSGGTIWLVLLVIGSVVGAILGTPWVLFSLIPTIIGFGTYWFRQITRSLRFAIAPTSAGVRLTFGLTTTVTETLPPGRVHAFEIRQPVLWRKFGWWAIRVNRITGRAATDSTAYQSAEVLPVGTRDDVERVLRLFIPDLTAEQCREMCEHGLFGRGGAVVDAGGDPYTTTPRRGWWLRPLSWRRNGFLLTPGALLLRSGVLRRVLVILPLARLQSLRITQGPVDRALSLANITGDTVLGQVSGALGILDKDAAYQLWQDAVRAAVAAASDDRSHRWGSQPVVVAPAGVGAAPTAETTAAAPAAGDTTAVAPAAGDTTAVAPAADDATPSLPSESDAASRPEA